MDPPHTVPIWLAQVRLDSLGGESVSLEEANTLLGEVLDTLSIHVPRVSGSCFPRATVEGERICLSIEIGTALLLEEIRPEVYGGLIGKLVQEWLPEVCRKRGWSATGWYWHGAWTFGGEINVAAE
jgi:hypothetical protein